MTIPENSPYLAAVSDAAAQAPPARPNPRTRPASAWIARHRIGVFLVLAFTISWWPWPLTLLNPNSSAMVPFGPIIAAVVVTAVTAGRRHLLALLRATVRWKVSWTRYLIALAGPFLAAGVIGALAIAFEVGQPSSVNDAYGWSTWSTVPLLFLTTALIGGPLFEEVGWRGFLLEELQRRHPTLVATAIVATVWAAWHLPLLISEPTGQRPPLPFLVWVLAQAVVLSWIYNTSSGSILIAVLFHTAVNVSARLLLQPFIGRDGLSAMWWLMASVYALVALVLIWRTRCTLGGGSAANPAIRHERVNRWGCHRDRSIAGEARQAERAIIRAELGILWRLALRCLPR